MDQSHTEAVYAKLDKTGIYKTPLNNTKFRGGRLDDTTSPDITINWDGLPKRYGCNTVECSSLVHPDDLVENEVYNNSACPDFNKFNDLVENEVYQTSSGDPESVDFVENEVYQTSSDVPVSVALAENEAC